MTPNEGQQILARLARMETKQDDMAEDVREVKAEVKRTNGRVTSIEARHVAEDAVKADNEQSRARWGGWFQPVVTGAAVAVIGTILAAIKF